jgi:hypothetical protein
MRGVAVEGYITSVQLPQRIDVNGETVLLEPDTSFGLQKDRVTTTNSPLKDELRIGAYVFVSGENSHRKITARTIRFHDDWNQKLQGVGPIERMISSGPEPVYRADGYPIRIAATTETKFHGDLKGFSEVAANTWMRYEGKRASDGMLVASKADFFSVKVKQPKTVNGVEDFKLKFEAPDLEKRIDGRVMLGIKGTWYTVPADATLQDRIQKLGMSLVPAAQRNLADDDPLRIKFHFYAFNDKKVRGVLISDRGALILVPRSVMERLPKTDQLAAEIALAIAAVLQRERASVLSTQKVALAEDAGLIAAYALSPAAGLAVDAGLSAAGLAAGQKLVEMALEQRGRIALGLMADAGYDPWQVPEAIRLLTPKDPPKDPDSLKYPNLSGYLLGILNLQYRDTHGAAAGLLNDGY